MTEEQGAHTTQTGSRVTGAHDEFLLAATAQNLRRMAKRLAPESSSNKLASA
jgi:hypothetical protein